MAATIATKTRRPADKHYTAIDGHEYTNSPRYSQYTGEWWFSSAYAVHTDTCGCRTDPGFFH